MQHCVQHNKILRSARLMNEHQPVVKVKQHRIDELTFYRQRMKMVNGFYLKTRLSRWIFTSVTLSNIFFSRSRWWILCKTCRLLSLFAKSSSHQRNFQRYSSSWCTLSSYNPKNANIKKTSTVIDYAPGESSQTLLGFEIITYLSLHMNVN